MLGGWFGKVRNDLYAGWLSPQRIRLAVSIFGQKAKKPVLDFNVQNLSQVRFRLYRSTCAAVARSVRSTDAVVYALAQRKT